MAKAQEKNGVVVSERAGKVPAPINQPLGTSFFSASLASSGVSVTETTALALSAVWAAVSTISQSIGTLPLNIYRRDGERRFLATELAEFDILHDLPNAEAPAAVVRSALVASSLLHGNAYAEIERDDSGRIIAVWPLHQASVTPWRNKDGDLYYRVLSTGKEVILFPDEILHFRNFSLDGFLGLSTLTQARDALGLNMGLEKYASKFFGSGARPGVLLKHPGRLSEEARARLRDGWAKVHQGLDNAHATAVLEEGMEAMPFSIPNDDAQFLESRKFGIEDIARWFNIPLSRLRVQGATAFANIEQDAIDFVTNTLRPHLVRIEQEINAKFFPGGDYFVEHAIEGLLRGDIKTRYEAYAIGRNWGWYSVNDIRALENLSPIVGGNQYLQPLNMSGLGQQTSGSTTAPATPQLGGITPAKPTADPIVAPVVDAAPVVDVAATALNGAQVTSLLELVTQASAGTISVSTAKAVAEAAFPSFDAAILAKIFGGIVVTPAPIGPLK